MKKFRPNKYDKLTDFASVHSTNSYWTPIICLISWKIKGEKEWVVALYPYGTQILIRSSSTDKTDNYCVVWLNYTQAVDCGD